MNTLYKSAADRSLYIDKHAAIKQGKIAGKNRINKKIITNWFYLNIPLPIDILVRNGCKY